MGLFDFLTGNSEDPALQAERERRRAATVQNLEAGGLPLPAIERLQEQASRQNTPGHVFTSDLSASELALLGNAGYEPLGQVMGVSVYHVGWQFGIFNGPSWWMSGSSQELTVLTQAFYNARHLAIGRLIQEAQLLGATGVVGVRLKHKQGDWGGELTEFSAIGTAIREHDHTGHAQQPFASALSGQEFWTLRQAGYRPVGLAVGNCTYYQIPTWSTQNAVNGGWFGGGSWQNMELPDYTQAVYTARELAMERMEKEALSFGGQGVIGASIDVDATPRHVEVNKRTRVDMIYHFTALGTSIVPLPPAHLPPRLSIGTTISLRPGGMVSKSLTSKDS